MDPKLRRPAVTIRIYETFKKQRPVIIKLGKTIISREVNTERMMAIWIFRLILT